MLFSQRKGLKPVRSLVQTDSIDEALRNALWDGVCLIILHDSSGQTDRSGIHLTLQRYWHLFFKQPIDTIPEYTFQAIEHIRRAYMKFEWNEVYDFIEMSAKIDEDRSKEFTDFCNGILERELSGYRFVGTTLVEVSSSEELESIEAALDATTPMSGVRAHLRKAVDLLADRTKPDYRNSSKESICAVESLLRIIAQDDKASLGDALKKVGPSLGMHPALQKSLSTLYGYTSDSPGIRHAMQEEVVLTFGDAKFVLVSCTAFVNYLVSKAAQMGLLPVPR